QQTEKKWKENNSLVDNYNTHYEKNKGEPPEMSEEELSLVDNYNTHYEKNKGEPPEMSEEELSELLVELDNLD
ncbi:hypothetical protein C6B38_06255, partial [Spiroplasma sp. ChiS]|uniref:hypothetical protein n=1 Tax=Spiroplasma sp. ChiS TaxID=2099885 RepID=UPI000D4CEA0C